MTATSWARRRARPEHRAAGGRGDVHDSEGARQAPHPRHRDVQRAPRRRVLLHAIFVGIEMVLRNISIFFRSADRCHPITCAKRP